MTPTTPRPDIQADRLAGARRTAEWWRIEYNAGRVNEKKDFAWLLKDLEAVVRSLGRDA